MPAIRETGRFGLAGAVATFSLGTAGAGARTIFVFEADTGAERPAMAATIAPMIAIPIYIPTNMFSISSSSPQAAIPLNIISTTGGIKIMVAPEISRVMAR